jgi:hypothetical protein
MECTVTLVDHGLPDMGYDEAFDRRVEVTAKASELGLIEQANRQVFHGRGFALTRDPETGNLWLTPSDDPEGWAYPPDQKPRRFVLVRDEDETGVSGTGIVAEGIRFSSGAVALQWTTDWPTSVVFHERGIESVEHVHGHNGKTRIEWMDRWDQ